MKSFTQKSFIMLVCFVLTVFLLPKISFAKGIIENQDPIFRDYITIGGVVLLALIVFGFIVSNNILRIRALNLENESMQRRISNYEVANKVFGSIFFECSHETNELTFDENYEAILGKMPHYKKLSEFGQTNPNIFPDDLMNIARFAQNLLKGAKYSSAEYRFIMPNGSLVWHKIEAQTFFELNGKPVSIVGRIININNQKLEMLRLQQIASSDSLTGLLSNRPAKAAISEFLQYEGKQGTHALYLLDLDNFHDVNYAVGHIAGDSILSLIAERLKAQFSDNDIVARLGGDEFIVLQKNVGEKSKIKAKADKVLEVLT
ncbi:MAG: sensor domain-containing diguanylate cyclase, partial [Clostridiales bacterium]|nr:sensor domain-containing diguanylate cyclase [Clostridiales bacterium]